MFGAWFGPLVLGSWLIFGGVLSIFGLDVKALALGLFEDVTVRFAAFGFFLRPKGLSIYGVKS